MPAKHECPEKRCWAPALEAGGVVAFEIDLTSGTMAFSTDPEHFLGIAADRIDVFTDRVYEPHREALSEALARAPRDARGFAIELRLEPPAKTRWLSLVGTADRSGGDSAARLHGVCFDITHRKRLEASLQDSESRFRDFAEISSDWLWETDEHHLFTQLLGAPASNRPVSLGKTRWQFAGADPTASPWREHVEDLEAHRAFRDFEYEVLVPPDDVFILSVSGRPFYDELGRFRGYRGSTSDLTQRRAMEAHLDRISKLETVGQVTSGIAHDFNNLLTIIAGNAEILVEDLHAATALRGRADLILNAARRGADLIDRLLTFARRQPLAPAAVSIEQVVDGMAGILRHALGEQISLRMNLAAPLPAAWVDATLLERAILNLAVNARDAMPRGGILKIETRAFHARDRSVELAPGPYIELSVTDTGCGMQPDVLKRVLDPFFTTKDAGKGWGLGLSTAYAFAKQSGGHLAIASEPGHGTVVRVCLPQAASAERETSKSGTSSPPPRGAERVLIVEDEADVRRFAESLLARLGYRTVGASDGPEALAILRSGEHFDLLFTDIVLPRHMNGLELAYEARKLQPALKVLFTSGYSEDAVERQGPRASDSRILRKPYLRHELAATLRRLLAPAAAEG